MDSYEQGLYNRMEKYANWAPINANESDAFADEFDSLWRSFTARKLVPNSIQQKKILTNFTTKVASLSNPPKDYIKVLTGRVYASYVNLTSHSINPDELNRYKILSNPLLPKRFLKMFVDSTDIREVVAVAEHRNTDTGLLYDLINSKTKTFVNYPEYVNDFISKKPLDIKIFLYLIENNALTKLRAIEECKRQLVKKATTAEEIRSIYFAGEENENFSGKASSMYLHALFSSKYIPLDVAEKALNYEHKTPAGEISTLSKVGIVKKVIENENIPNEIILTAASNRKAAFAPALQSVVYHQESNRVMNYIKEEYQLDTIPDSFIKTVLQWNDIMDKSRTQGWLGFV
jgi:hypothetical protein